MGHRDKELIALLPELFNEGELRRWAHGALGNEFYDSLPGAPIDLNELCFQLVLQAQRRGLVNESFFEQLIVQRPGKAKRIQAVAAQWFYGQRVSSSSAFRSADANALPPLSSEHIPEPAPLPAGSRMHLANNPLFLGRSAAMRRLAEALQVGKTATVTQVAAATGLGGIGKTQLAAAFVHRYGQFFSGGVFWLNFADPASVSAEVALCGGPEHLGLWPAEAAPDIDAQVAMVRKVWSEPVPRLLVFDNCEDEALVARWRPRSGGCRVLVTCRRRMFSPHLGVHVQDLDVLPRAESLTLLRSFLGDEAATSADEAVLSAICDELGDLPLALHLAGSFLVRYRAVVTPRTYLAQLRDRSWLGHPSLQGRGTDGSPTDHDLHVSRTLALSWNRLNPADAVDTSAGFLMRVAACLAPGEPISRPLLTATLGMPHDDPDAAIICEDALRRLLDLGLLGVSGPGEYTIHRLVMAFVQQTDGDHATARTAIEQALLDEAKRVNQSGYPGPLLPWQQHLRAVADAAYVREDERTANLCMELASHLRQLGDYRDARPYCERALAIREKHLGLNHPLTAQSIDNLAVLLHLQGALAEARLLFERALAIREQQMGPEHPLVASSLNNLAALLRDQNAHSEARPLLERALAICERQLGPEHPHTATRLNNLAAVLHAQGAHSEARPLYERALAIRERQLTPDHPHTARSLNNLAELLREQGAYAEAWPLYERALAIREQQLGPYHPDTAMSLNNLAELLREQGAYAEARPLFERALAICEARLAPDHLYTRLIRKNLEDF